jgi:glycosyltransferase involved in cell wall biosynthesis
VKGPHSLVVTTTSTVDDKLRRRGVGNTVRFRPTYALPDGLLRELEAIGRSEAKADRPTFALSGRQIAWKGQLYALRALAIVKERLPDVQLHLIGDGADHHLLLAEIERLGLGDCVMVHRTADRDEERRLIAGSHALVSASTRDGGSSLLQFAMALETIIVGLDVGVVSQIVGPDAVLISPDPSSTVVERLADAMIDVWVDEERRHELESRARERLTATLAYAEVEASLDDWYERAAKL